MILSTSAPGGEMAPELDQLVEGQLVLLELADRQRRPVNGDRWRDHVDARPSGRRASQIGLDSSDAATDLADDALADIHQLLLVAEADVGQLDLAVNFDIGLARIVHHDVGDVVGASSGSSGP